MQYSRQKFITGFQAYLVGGCVRDLLLKRVPKDFDVITTASLEQVLVHSNIMINFSFPESFDVLIPLTYFCLLQLKKNIFRRSMIVGKRFPICLLKMRDSVIEVCSSYHHHGHMSFLAMHSLFFICSNRFRAFEQLLSMGIEVKQ